MNLLLVAALVVGLVTSTQGATCTVCESTYTSDKGSAADDPAKCTAIKTYMTCMEGNDGTGCPLTTAQAGAIATDYAAITCVLDPLCTCQKDYWATDISAGDPDDCNAAKARVACLRGKTGTACDTSSAINVLGATTDAILTALTGCSLTAACTCERNYVKADVSDDTKMCTESLTFLGCLKGIDGNLCGTASVVTAAGEADTVQSGLSSPACSPSVGCACEITYAKADIADNAKKCTQAGTFISCLKTKTGTGCDGATDIAAMATTADTDMKAVTGCTQSAGCVCEATYAKADIADDTKKCTQAGTFISCLKTNTGTGCDGATTVAAMATTADTAMKAVTGCTQTAGCLCEVAYAKADIADDTKKCTAVKTYISCLKANTGMGCDGATTVAQLATAAESTASGITGCTLASTTCGCELAYAKADIGDDTKLCTQTKAYVDCLKDKAATGCVDTKSALVTAAKSTMSGITGGACAIASTVCECDADYAALDVSTDALKCTANKNYISCLLGKTGTGCAGATLIVSATTAESAITTIGSTCTKTPVCDCETTYAKADISDNTKKCTATKALTTCITLSIDNGCGESTTKTNVGAVATASFTALDTNCAKSATCNCQATFNAADVTASAKCTSANALITCLGAITSTTETACDGTQITTDLKTNATTSVQAALCSFGARVEASSFLAVFLMTMAVLVISL